MAAQVQQQQQLLDWRLHQLRLAAIDELRRDLTAAGLTTQFADCYEMVCDARTDSCYTLYIEYWHRYTQDRPQGPALASISFQLSTPHARIRKVNVANPSDSRNNILKKCLFQAAEGYASICGRQNLLVRCKKDEVHADWKPHPLGQVGWTAHAEQRDGKTRHYATKRVAYPFA